MPRIAVDSVEPDKSVSVKPEPKPPVAAAVNATDEELKKVSSTSTLAAFTAFPEGIFFSGEGEDEEIILLLRAHVITNVPWVLTALGLTLLPLILVPVAGAAGLGSMFGAGASLAFVLVWYLGLFTYSFINFLYWYFNVGIVTNERVVDIDWNSLTHKEVTTALISKIQDVTPKQIGVLAAIFDYGSIYVQTAGTEPNIEFLNVPHPLLVTKKIQELMQQEETEWEHGNS